MKAHWDIREFYKFGATLGDLVRFESFVKDAAEEIAVLLVKQLRSNTPVKTGKLQSGWGNYEIKRVETGFEVTITNKVEYATWVNDGHYSKNQYGGPYFVYNRTPKIAPEYGETDDDTFVFGHFFVEISIYQIAESKKIEQIVYDQLQKWWKGCLNG